MHFHVLMADEDDDPDRIPCCMGTAAGCACTCWEDEYDQPQLPAQEGPPAIAPGPCSTCACRPGSPERLEDDTPYDQRQMASSWELVQSLAARGEPFWCHQGMRRRVRERHPDGRVREVGEHDWAPGVRPGTPLQASGEPAVMCGGWAAMARARG